MRMARHILIVAAALFLLIGVPVIASGYPGRLASGTDVISSATVIIDQPSGGYVVLINRDRHPDAGKLTLWDTFFSGGEIDYIFEDISCMAAASDEMGIEVAKSFMSRLPENQMTLSTVDTTLLLSKAYYGSFDIIIMSREVFSEHGGESFKEGTDIDIIYGSKEGV